MYSEQTYEVIKQRILDNIETEIDKREGAFTNSMISPISVELAKAYMLFSDILNMAFVENNFYEKLDEKVEEWGLNRKQGTKSVGTVKVVGETGTNIQNGTIFTFNNLEFIMLNDINIGEEDDICYLEAMEIGSKYNLIKNSTLTLKESIEGIKSITAIENFKNGTDVETDEELKKRFRIYIQKNSTSGNVNDYINWVTEVEGVGDCKVFPLWNGNGTVKVVIISYDRRGASPELVEKTKEHIEEKRPIGANVTVVSAVEKTLNINAKLTLANGYSLQEVKEEIEDNLKKFIYENAFKNTYVSLAKIGSLILESNGVLDYTDFTINGETSNISLEDNEVPVIGSISVVI